MRSLITPNTINDWTKFFLVILIVVGAIYLQATTGNIPDWMLIAVSSIVAYYLGLSSNYSPKVSDNANVQ